MRAQLDDWRGPTHGQVWLWEVSPEQLAYVLLHRHGIDGDSLIDSGAATAGVDDDDEDDVDDSAAAAAGSRSAAPSSPAAKADKLLLAHARRLVARARAYYEALPPADKAELARLVDVKFNLEAAKAEWRARVAGMAPPAGWSREELEGELVPNVRARPAWLRKGGARRSQSTETLPVDGE